jgi:hypothetical protein
MTGCDLRFLAEEMASAARRASLERADSMDNVSIETRALADVLDRVPLLADLAFKVRQIASLVNEQSDGIRADATTAFDKTHETIEQIRAHFHEAVDQRVQDEQADHECDCSEEMSDAVSEAKADIRRAIERALDDEGC